MAIQFACSSCQQEYSVPEAAAGKKTSCKKCGKPLTVPQAETPAVSPLAGNDDLSSLLDEAAELENSAASSPLGTPAKNPLGTSAGLALGTPKKSAAAAPIVVLAVAIGGGVLLLLLVAIGIAALFFQSSGDTNPPRPGDVATANGGTTPGGNSSSTHSENGTSDPPRDAEVTTGDGTIKTVTPETRNGADPTHALPVTGRAQIPWTAKVDPAPASDLADFVVKDDLAADVDSSVDIVVPRSASPFVLLVSNAFRKEGLLTVDLRTGQPAKQLGGKFDLRREVHFHPDGELVAGLGISAKEVTVVSLADGAIKNIEPTEARRVEQIGWTAEGKLLTVEEPRDALLLALWDVSAGRQESQLKIPKVDRERFVEGSAIPTPGGRYVVLMVGKTLCVYEVATGKCVGTSRLPGEGSISYRCQGIAFSPDAGQLAAYAEVGSDAWLFCWEFATGELLVSRHFKEDPIRGITYASSYKGSKLVWLPGASAWLLSGHVVLDGKTGAPVWKLPSTNQQARVALGPTKFVIPKSGKSGIHTLAVHEVPRDELTQAIQIIRSGGRTDDVGLPPLARIDLASARKIESPNASQAWTYEPDVRKEQRKALTKPLRINSDYGQPRQAMLARDTNQLVVLWNNALRRKNDAPPGFLQSYQIGRTGRGTIELPAAYELKSVSPQGKFVLLGQVQRSYGSSRLDIYSLSNEKHVAGWRPYADAGETRDETATFAEFVDDEHILTANRIGRLVLWKLPELQPVYVIEELRPLALSAGGRFLAMWDEASVRVVICDSLTGEYRGTLQGGSKKYMPSGAAFHPDGSKLAAYRAGELLIWDLAKRELTHEVSIHSVNAQPLKWLDPRYLLAGHRYLVDVNNRAVVWQYENQGATPVSGAADDKFWFIGRDPLNMMPGYYLGAGPVPSQQVKAATAGITQEDLLILGPGGKASVNVSASVSGVDAAKIRQSLTEKLTANGVTVDASAPVRVVVSGSQRATGETLEYQPEFGRGEKIKVPVHVITAALTISDNKGGRWEMKQEFKTSGSFFERGDVQKNLQDELRGQFEGFARGSSIPKFVYPIGGSDNIGRSQMTLRGEVPVKKK